MNGPFDPQKVLLTIDITEEGRLTCWTASRADGKVMEDWRRHGEFMSAAASHTWELASEGYLAVRDVLRYLTEPDWEPGTFM